MTTIEIPEPLATKAMELGLDIEKFVIESLLNKLKLDPKKEAQVHIILAKKFLEEGKNWYIPARFKPQKSYIKQQRNP